MRHFNNVLAAMVFVFFARSVSADAPYYLREQNPTTMAYSDFYCGSGYACAQQYADMLRGQFTADGDTDIDIQFQQISGDDEPTAWNIIIFRNLNGGLGFWDSYGSYPERVGGGGHGGVTPTPLPTPTPTRAPDDGGSGDDSCSGGASSSACAPMGNIPEVASMPASAVDVSVSSWQWHIGIVDGVCPAPKVVSVYGAQLSFTSDTVCDFARRVRPLVIALSVLSAAFIVIKGLKS